MLKEGDTLAQIAARVYGDPAQWTIIFYANQDRLGANQSLLVPGLALKVPCVSGLQPQQPLPSIATTPAQATAVPEAAYSTSSLVPRIELLTAEGYTPIRDVSLEGGGVLTDVISAAMGLVKRKREARFDYSISWVNDWTAHLNPLLMTQAFDAGFRWERPDCDGGTPLMQTRNSGAKSFLLGRSDREVATYVFVRTDSRIKTLNSEDVADSTLCRPSVRLTHELDQGGRNWLRDGKIKLVRPNTIDECFRLLDTGTVDGVVEAELVARGQSMNALGASLTEFNRLNSLFALLSLHAVVSKSHHASTHHYSLHQYFDGQAPRQRRV